MVTKQLIMDTAMRLFLEHGVKTVTIDRIVGELHTSKRTLYGHFKDKTTLLTACLLSYHQRISKENDALIKQSRNSIEAFANVLHAIVQRAGQVNPNFFNDILHYYPGLLHQSYRNSGNFAHRQL
ncbi:MAG: TetR/AcrR family transcriptional regulator, partial [Cyanobacteria bacterium J06649_11]